MCYKYSAMYIVLYVECVLNIIDYPRLKRLKLRKIFNNKKFKNQHKKEVINQSKTTNVWKIGALILKTF